MKNLKRKLELYEQLFRTFGPGESLCQISQLASLWQVSDRYVFTLLKSFEASNWISWQASSGRHKKAALTCLIEPIEACHQLAQPLAELGQIETLFNTLSFGGRQAGHELQVFLNETHRRLKRVVLIPFHRRIEPLHPHRVLRRTERFLVTQIYQRLTRVVDGELIGDLAFHWQANTSGTQWYFQLRHEVQFHDGRNLSASDVVRCLEALVNSDAWSSSYQHIASISAPTDSTVQIALNQTDWHLPRLLARAEASVFRVYSSGAFTGSGAFSLDVFSSNMLRLRRNTSYTYQVSILDRIELWFYPEWAPQKACAHNQIRMQLPETTIKHALPDCATFMLIQSGAQTTTDPHLVVEDTTESKQLGQQIAAPNDPIITIPYGHYRATPCSTVCSIIEENDPYSAWLIFLMRYPFRCSMLSTETLSQLHHHLRAIRQESDFSRSQVLLSRLIDGLCEQGVITILKQEPFVLELSERLQGCQINGYGWCELNTLWPKDIRG
ncbi:ABC transporter substrate-binding protein (plasmid) [Vibrio tubiashii]|uniref:ABC transporter substrate-binding protein n=1 Tax=Vibrio tubiashii TaxID=29498 RepID=UPI003CE5433F